MFRETEENWKIGVTGEILVTELGPRGSLKAPVPLRDLFRRLGSADGNSTILVPFPHRISDVLTTGFPRKLLSLISDFHFFDTKMWTLITENRPLRSPKSEF